MYDDANIVILINQQTIKSYLLFTNLSNISLLDAELGFGICKKQAQFEAISVILMGVMC